MGGKRWGMKITEVGEGNRLTSLLSDAPPKVLELEPRCNRRVHCSSLVRRSRFHGTEKNNAPTAMHHPRTASQRCDGTRKGLPKNRNAQATDAATPTARKTPVG
jgi:hypothetical protein